MLSPDLTPRPDGIRAEPATLAALNRQIAKAPPLSAGAERPVFGEGKPGARIAFVGEQPGDQEERQGRPFVGPAGKLLYRAIDEAGIDRSKIYVTNAVKHFKFDPRGERRLHKRPNRGEIKRYRWWLQKELQLVHPHIVVALGATALLGLTGESPPLKSVRGPHELMGFKGYITVHPSSLLRIRDGGERHRAFDAFRDDLERVARLARSR
jgi:DNA polymerase